MSKRDKPTVDLKQFRKTNGLYQKEVAEYLGVTIGFISAVERGESKLPAAKLEQLLNNSKGWDTAWLEGGVSSKDLDKLKQQVKRLSGQLDALRKQLREKDYTIDGLKQWIKLGDTLSALVNNGVPTMMEGFNEGDIVVNCSGNETELIGKLYFMEIVSIKGKAVKLNWLEPILCFGGNAQGYAFAEAGVKADDKALEGTIIKGKYINTQKGRYFKWNGVPIKGLFNGFDEE